MTASQGKINRRLRNEKERVESQYTGNTYMQIGSEPEKIANNTIIANAHLDTCEKQKTKSPDSHQQAHTHTLTYIAEHTWPKMWTHQQLSLTHFPRLEKKSSFRPINNLFTRVIENKIK